MADKYKIFGTVKEVIVKSSAEVEEIKIVPTQEYAMKGTIDSNKTYALLRPADDDGSTIRQLLYKDTVSIRGPAIADVAAIMGNERIVGFVLKSDAKKKRGVINVMGDGNVNKFILDKIILK